MSVDKKEQETIKNKGSVVVGFLLRFKRCFTSKSIIIIKLCTSISLSFKNNDYYS